MDLEETKTVPVRIRGLENEVNMLLDDESRGFVEGFPRLRLIRTRDDVAHLDMSSEQLQLLRDAALRATQTRYGICSNSSMTKMMQELSASSDPGMKEFVEQFIRLFGEATSSTTEASMSVHRWASEWGILVRQPKTGTVA